MSNVPPCCLYSPMAKPAPENFLASVDDKLVDTINNVKTQLHNLNLASQKQPVKLEFHPLEGFPIALLITLTSFGLFPLHLYHLHVQVLHPSALHAVKPIYPLHFYSSCSQLKPLYLWYSSILTALGDTPIAYTQQESSSATNCSTSSTSSSDSSPANPHDTNIEQVEHHLIACQQHYLPPPVLTPLPMTAFTFSTKISPYMQI